ncbi:MAG: UDP-N-acetylmuramate dehydrogenase [Capnocytophaga sp.]|nr:UDP-N-acetylmuramate dehydrogenase [Capnocytophaga sp.]
MEVFQNISLQDYNSFGINVEATLLIKVYTDTELNEALRQYPNALILGGGSNMLFTQHVSTPLLQICFKGIKVVSEEENTVLVEAKAGENWHEFVMFCLQSGYGGIENLALIPGRVGTTPIQNIGAYGVEIKDVLDYCEAVNVYSLERRIFSNDECRFGYRDSIFKNDERGNYVITSVTFKLTKNKHAINDQYGTIKQILVRRQITNPTPLDVANAVIHIRQSKLPDPKVLGNGGSFFKNPIVERSFSDALREQFPELPSYPYSEENVKIPAAWLIEASGLKGHRIGDAGVHDKQALVLVNHGNASGSDIWALAQYVQMTVFKTFGIRLEPEVNVF